MSGETNGVKCAAGATSMLTDLSFDFFEGRELPSKLGRTDVPITLLPELAFEIRAPIDANDLARACRTFMQLAYPEGVDSVPDNKRPYFNIPCNGSIFDFLPPAPSSRGIGQDLSKLKGAVQGYEFRLGSAEHPHLKLRIQHMDFHHRPIWVYSVDTHDRFLQATQHLSAEEAAAWRKLTESNRVLKQRIEEALAAAGFITPVSLLRLDLTS